MKTIAQTLHEARIAKGLRLKSVAIATGTPMSNVSRYESGKRRPDADYLRKVASVFGLDPVALLAQAAEEYSRADGQETRDRYAKETP
jgi:transcriptional regulator with XRE-family HTH domain